MGYYSLADHLTQEAKKVFWLTNTSFFCTLAAKRRGKRKEVTKSLQQGPGRYSLAVPQKGGEIRRYELYCSTRQLRTGAINYDQPDWLPNTLKYQSRTELGKRLLAQRCEWCGDEDSLVEGHHVRKLGNLTGKTLWERRMRQRRRKTMGLCVECHRELHTGKLKEQKRMLRENGRAGYIERRLSGSEGSGVETWRSNMLRRTVLTLRASTPAVVQVQGVRFLPITATGWQCRQMGLVNDAGFPRTRAKLQSRVRGFRTGVWCGQ